MSNEHLINGENKAGEGAAEKTAEKSAGVAAFLLLFLALMVAGVGLMDISLLKAPDLIQMIYDKVTLPQSMLFITHLKGLFAFLVMVVSCIPALLVMGGTAAVMSKFASIEQKEG